MAEFAYNSSVSRTTGRSPCSLSRFWPLSEGRRDSPNTFLQMEEQHTYIEKADHISDLWGFLIWQDLDFITSVLCSVRQWVVILMCLLFVLHAQFRYIAIWTCWCIVACYKFIFGTGMPIIALAFAGRLRFIFCWQWTRVAYLTKHQTSSRLSTLLRMKTKRKRIAGSAPLPSVSILQGE